MESNSAMCFSFALKFINGVVDECGNSIVNYKDETINKIFISIHIPYGTWRLNTIF